MLLPQLLKNTTSSPVAAPITQAGSGYIHASGEDEFHHIPLCAPYGIYSIPSENAQALIIPMDNAAVCAGVLSPFNGDFELEPGELRLYSGGGASIVLKNNGDVIINGLTITKNGTILESGAKEL